LLDGDEAILEAVTAAFGAGVRLADGRIDRAALGRIVFGDPEMLRRLEGITHPAVRAEIARRIAATAASTIVIEAIKLLEGPLAAACDQVWVTACPRETQLERLRVCRGMDEATAVTRVDAQGPQSEKIARADVVIETAGLMSATQAQFEAAWAGVARQAPAVDR
jgi:dephospho-CoA kinase